MQSIVRCPPFMYTQIRKEKVVRFTDLLDINMCKSCFRSASWKGGKCTKGKNEMVAVGGHDGEMVWVSWRGGLV